MWVFLLNPSQSTPSEFTYELAHMTKVKRSSFTPTLEVHIIFLPTSNFYCLDLHNKTCVALVNLREIISKNHTYPYLGTILKLYVCWFLSWISRSSHLCSTIGRGVMNKIWRHSPISSNPWRTQGLDMLPKCTIYKGLIEFQNKTLHFYVFETL